MITRFSFYLTMESYNMLSNEPFYPIVQNNSNQTTCLIGITALFDHSSPILKVLELYRVVEILPRLGGRSWIHLGSYNSIEPHHGSSIYWGLRFAWCSRGHLGVERCRKSRFRPGCTASGTTCPRTTTCGTTWHRHCLARSETIYFRRRGQAWNGIILC